MKGPVHPKARFLLQLATQIHLVFGFLLPPQNNGIEWNYIGSA